MDSTFSKGFIEARVPKPPCQCDRDIASSSNLSPQKCHELHRGQSRIGDDVTNRADFPSTTQIIIVVCTKLQYPITLNALIIIGLGTLHLISLKCSSAWLVVQAHSTRPPFGTTLPATLKTEALFEGVSKSAERSDLDVGVGIRNGANSINTPRGWVQEVERPCAAKIPKSSCIDCQAETVSSCNCENTYRCRCMSSNSVWKTARKYRCGPRR